eukprot:10628835-Karenia_brevis.AAC.1
MSGQPERSTQPPRPPAYFDPMHRVVPGREKSLATEIEEQRNMDHNGALPLYLPLVGEDYDFK